MADYADIYGKRVKELTDDPTLTSSYEGQVWYNENSGTLRSAVAIKAWSSGGNMVTTRRAMGSGFGAQTAGVAVGGYTTTFLNATEEYNGSGWASSGNYPTSLYYIASAGTETAGVAAGGGDPVSSVVCEYNGSTWTAVTSIPTAARGMMRAGTQTSALFGGGFQPSTTGVCFEYDGTNWTGGGTMNTARGFAGCSGSQTDAVFFGGGAVANTEEYNGTAWSEQTDLPSARAAVGFANDTTSSSAISAGGVTPPGTRITTCDTYDGSSWSSIPALSTAREQAASGAGTSAGTYVAGGTTSGPAISSTEEYNQSINTITSASWASGGALNTGRYGLRGTGTQTAMVVAGGNVPPNSNTAVTEEYNGSSWTNSTSLPAVVQDGNMTGTETASIYAGGSINPGSYPGNTYAYNGSSWTSGGNMNTDVSQYGLTGTSTAAVAFGGYTPGSPGRTADVQNYNGSSWTANPTSLPAVRGLLRTTGTQTATFMASGNAPPGPQPVTSFSYDGSSFSSEADSIVGMNDNGAWGTATEAYFMGGDQPTPTGGTGPKAIGNFYYNGTSWATSVNMTTGKNTFGWSKSPNTAGLVCGGNASSPHQNTTEEFTEGTSVATAKTLTTS